MGDYTAGVVGIDAPADNDNRDKLIVIFAASQPSSLNNQTVRDFCQTPFIQFCLIKKIANKTIVLV